MLMQSKESGSTNNTLTIFTIPESFVHIETGEIQKVTPEMHRFFQKHLEQNNVINAFMSAVYDSVHDNRQSVELVGLERKVEEVLQLLKGNNLVSAPVEKTFTDQIDLPNDLIELLDEFGG
ncbi:hypothetical protein [Bacillus sp. T3]|uniref:hypothetical protein n=1 Tax=Bacillus sp. T3 TaxID=467262 RepID=UPI002980F048|nr:hypothetical protein [Bacillus sp. T3]